MSVFRVAATLVRQAPRLGGVRRPTSFISQGRRLLNTDTAPVLYSVHADAVGARNGHVSGSEGLELDLATPKGMGGSGGKGKTNPEELFAAGYGACFQSAMNLCAPAVGVKMPAKPEDSLIKTTVHMVGDIKAGDLGLRVDMLVKVKGISKADMEKLVEKTKQVCPYSRATQGNVSTNVTIEEA